MKKTKMTLLIYILKFNKNIDIVLFSFETPIFTSYKIRVLLIFKYKSSRTFSISC